VPVYSGSGAPELPGLTLTGVADSTAPTFAATGVPTLPGLELSGTADTTAPTYSASGAPELPGLTLSGTGDTTVPIYTGTATPELPGLTLSGAATFQQDFNASGSLTLPGLELTGTGSTETIRTATGSLTLPGLELTGVADYSPPVCSGSGAPELPGLILTGTADVTNPTYSATGALELPGLTLAGTGSTEETVIGAGTVELPGLTLTGTATFTPKFTGTGSLTLGGLELVGVATFEPEFNASGSLTLSGIELVGAGTITPPIGYVSASGSLVLPGLIAFGFNRPRLLFVESEALSCEVPAAIQLAARLSETPAIQQLTETDNAADAHDKIVVGIDQDPFDGEVYSPDDLAARHFIAHVYAEPEDGHAVVISPEAMGVPREGGVLRAYLCRQIRDSEDPQDAYTFFWDRVSSIGAQVIEASEINLLTPRNFRFVQADRPIGPTQTMRKAEAGQGKQLEAILRFSWGDFGTE
jgi:hypothetical protein